MGKQPYIPFYIGDYLKDTRVLPLSVRGAWVDLILFMWDNPIRGELSGTLDEYARIMSCTVGEAEFALNLLKQKNTADIKLLPGGVWLIVSRRMKSDAELSKKRSIAGKIGVDAKFASANGAAKPQANSEYEYEVDNESSKQSKAEIKKEIFSDEIFMGNLKMNYPNKNFDKIWDECYLWYTQRPRPPQVSWEWRQKLISWASKSTSSVSTRMPSKNH